MKTQMYTHLVVVTFILIVLVLFIGIIITLPRRREKLRKLQTARNELHPTSSKADVQAPDQTLNMLLSDPKHCPFCRGDIEPGVLKCKHCGEWLDPNKRKEQEVVKTAQLETAKTSRSTNQAIGWIIFILFGLPALYALFRGC